MNKYDPKSKYIEPHNSSTTSFKALLDLGQRDYFKDQRNFFESDGYKEIYYAGDLELLRLPNVSIIGSRDANIEAQSRAWRLAKELASRGIAVVSGLAKGVDRAAHLGALENGGRTLAVIGTPLNKAYPSENSRLQEIMYSEQLLISQFSPGQRIFPSNFVKRNRTMCALSDASVIVEASDSSGTLHQAKECLRLGRPLFIMSSVAKKKELNWPLKFLREEGVYLLENTEQVFELVCNRVGNDICDNRV